MLWPLLTLGCQLGSGVVVVRAFPRERRGADNTLMGRTERMSMLRTIAQVRSLANRQHAGLQLSFATALPSTTSGFAPRGPC